jgi:hypothetical protein
LAAWPLGAARRGAPCCFASLTLARPTCARLQRGERLLKPLPAEAIPCDKLPDGPEPVAVEVEYPARGVLPRLEEEPPAALARALAGMQSADWVETCGALTCLRQLVVHQPDAAGPEL